jgi:hypothetical protein
LDKSQSSATIGLLMAEMWPEADRGRAGRGL